MESSCEARCGTPWLPTTSSNQNFTTTWTIWLRYTFTIRPFTLMSSLDPRERVNVPCATSLLLKSMNMLARMPTSHFSWRTSWNRSWSVWNVKTSFITLRCLWCLSWQKWRWMGFVWTRSRWQKPASSLRLAWMKSSNVSTNWQASNSISHHPNR